MLQPQRGEQALDVLVAHHVLAMCHWCTVHYAARLAQVVWRNAWRRIMMRTAGHWRRDFRNHSRAAAETDACPGACRGPRLIGSRRDLHRLQALQFFEVKVKDGAVVKVALHLETGRRLQLMHSHAHLLLLLLL